MNSVGVSALLIFSAIVVGGVTIVVWIVNCLVRAFALHQAVILLQNDARAGADVLRTADSMKSYIFNGLARARNHGARV